MQQTRVVRHHKYSGGDTSMQRVVIYLWREGTSCFMYHRVIRDGTFAAFLLKKGAIVRRLYPIFAETLFLENQKCQLCGVQQITKVMAIIHASSSIQINISVWTKAVNQLFSRFRSFHSGPAKRDYGNSLGFDFLFHFVGLVLMLCYDPPLPVFVSFLYFSLSQPLSHPAFVCSSDWSHFLSPKVVLQVGMWEQRGRWFPVCCSEHFNSKWTAVFQYWSDKEEQRKWIM